MTLSTTYIYGMSQWYDLSTNSNKLRQSYLRGFLDISGGGILLRGGNSMSFYDSPSDLTPTMSIKHDNINIIHDSSNYDVSAHNLRHLVRLSENVQDAIDELRARATNITGDGSATLFDGDTTISGELIVLDDLSLSENLYVAGTSTQVGGVTMYNTLDVTGAVDFDSILSVSGDVDFGANLYVVGDTSLNGTLDVSGSATFRNGISTTTAYVENILTVDGDVSMNSALSVATDVSIGQNLDVGGTVTADRLDINDIRLEGNEILTTPGTDLIIRPGSNVVYDDDVDRRVRIIGDLHVDGSINFTGDFIHTDTIVRVTEQLDVSNDGTGPALVVTQHGMNDIFKVVDDSETVLIIKDGGNMGINTELPTSALSVSGGITLGSLFASDINYEAADGELIVSDRIGIGVAPEAALDVSGVAQFRGTLDDALDRLDTSTTVYNYITLGKNGTSEDFVKFRQLGEPDTVDASGTNALALDFHRDANDANFFIRSVDVSENGTDEIVTRFAVKNDKVGINTDAPVVELDVSGAAHISDDLTLDGILTVGEDAFFSQSIYIAGDLSATSAYVDTLDVSGMASFSSNAYFTQNVDVSGVISASGISLEEAYLGQIHVAQNYIESDVGTVLELRPGKNTGYDNSGTNSTDHKVRILGDLQVDGSINFTGDFIRTDTIVRVTEQMRVENHGTGPAATVVQYGNEDIFKIIDGNLITSAITYYVRVGDITQEPYYLFSMTSGGTALNSDERPFTLIPGRSYTFIGADASLSAHPFVVGDASTEGLFNTSSIQITSTASTGPLVTNTGTTGSYFAVGNGTQLSFSITNGTASGDYLKYHSASDVTKYQNFYITDDASGEHTALVVKSGGFVGINTEEPTNMLDVNGEARIRQQLRVDESIVVGDNLEITNGNLELDSGYIIQPYT